MRAVPAALGLVVLALAAVAGVRLEAGLDYFVDAGGPIDWLVRGDLQQFFANQPLMGPLSLLVRAPFVALVFSSSEPTVYMIGVVPCLAALVALAVVLVRRMEAVGRPGGERLVVAAVCLASPLMVRAVHWGHAEELLCSALAVGGVLAASLGRAGWAGILLGAAIATKQWAVIAVLPALVAYPGGRVRIALAATAVAAVFYLPMLAGDPERFLTVVRAASSTEPAEMLGAHVAADLPGSRVTPTNVWWPFSTAYTLEPGTVYRQPEWLGRLTHTLILLVAAGLALLAWRRHRGGLAPRDALRLLALLLLVRGALDPMSLDYYHLGVVVALAAAGAVGTRRDVIAAGAGTIALGLVFAAPARSMYDISAHAGLKWPVYMVACAALAWWLARGGLLAGEAVACAPDARPLAQGDRAREGAAAERLDRAGADPLAGAHRLPAPAAHRTG